jgi:crotonobetainyl-CoA:carnitine CoA-transferase CaiB-like acyl-CoA transferase
MLDVQISLLNYMATMHLMSGHVPERIGNSHFVHVPYNAYQTQTGYIIIACIGDAFFEKFRDVLVAPELKDPRYLLQPARFQDREKIDAIIQAELVGNSAEYWLDRLRGARIPCAPVNNFEQALNDSQIRARDMVVNVQLQNGETVQMPGNPVKIGGMSDITFEPPPMLGEHTESVLRNLLGYDEKRIESLRDCAAIQ